MLKGILVIIDGIGDLPNKQLNGKTPLELAETKNMDFLATRGELGYMYPVKPGFVPESSEALISIFGNKLILSARGQLEARGAGLKLVRGDLALRVNFANVDFETQRVFDRRVGRTLTGSESEALSKSLNKIKLPCKFEFVLTSQHKAVLVLRGGFSDNVSGNDEIYSQGRFKPLDKIISCKAKDDEEDSQYTANILNEFIEKARDVLKNHVVNLKRERAGLMSANFLLVRGAGSEEPKLKQYKNWMAVAYSPLELGFAKLSGMKVFSFDYPKLKKLDSYEIFYNGLKKACSFSIKSLKKNYKKFDYVYIHIRETDWPGHDNKPFEKKLMLEYIDKTLIKFLRKFAPYNKIKVVVTGDHSTPCKLKNHSADPVPVLFYNDSILREKTFNEKDCRRGILGRVVGGELFDKTFFRKD